MRRPGRRRPDFCQVFFAVAKAPRGQSIDRSLAWGVGRRENDLVIANDGKERPALSVSSDDREDGPENRVAGSEALVGEMYDALRRLAAARMAAERPGHTLQATALVHEAYLKLAGDTRPPGWDGRGHFFASAARAMRQILIDAARHRGAVKRGGDLERLPLSHVDLAGGRIARDQELLDIDDALERLERRDRRKAEIVHLRYFAGLSIEQTAETLGLSRTTVKDEWTFARAWLQSEIER